MGGTLRTRKPQHPHPTLLAASATWVPPQARALRQVRDTGAGRGSQRDWHRGMGTASAQQVLGLLSNTTQQAWVIKGSPRHLRATSALWGHLRAQRRAQLVPEDTKTPKKSYGAPAFKKQTVQPENAKSFLHPP